MKKLITALLVLSSYVCFAEFKVEVVNKKGSEFSGVFETKEKADKWIKQQSREESWGRNSYTEVLKEGEDSSKCETVTQETVSVRESVRVGDEFEEVTSEQVLDKCNMSQEYSVAITDITQDKLDKDAKIKKDKEDRSALIVKLKKGKASMGEVQQALSEVLDALRRNDN